MTKLFSVGDSVEVPNANDEWVPGVVRAAYEVEYWVALDSGGGAPYWNHEVRSSSAP